MFLLSTRAGGVGINLTAAGELQALVDNYVLLDDN